MIKLNTEMTSSIISKTKIVGLSDDKIKNRVITVLKKRHIILNELKLTFVFSAGCSSLTINSDTFLFLQIS